MIPCQLFDVPSPAAATPATIYLTAIARESLNHIFPVMPFQNSQPVNNCERFWNLQSWWSGAEPRWIYHVGRPNQHDSLATWENTLAFLLVPDYMPKSFPRWNNPWRNLRIGSDESAQRASFTQWFFITSLEEMTTGCLIATTSLVWLSALPTPL